VPEPAPVPEPPYPVDPRREVAVTILEDPWPLSGYAEPGSCYPDKENTYNDHLLFACPGCGKVGSIPVRHPKAKETWDLVAGTISQPDSLTLAPSVHCVGCCGWHGFLCGGNWQLKYEPPRTTA